MLYERTMTTCSKYQNISASDNRAYLASCPQHSVKIPPQETSDTFRMGCAPMKVGGTHVLGNPTIYNIFVRNKLHSMYIKKY